MGKPSSSSRDEHERPPPTAAALLRRWAPGCLAVSLGLAALGWWAVRSSLERFAPVSHSIDMVTVETGHRDTLRVIADQDSIARILAFINDRTEGWGGVSDMFGVPVPQVTAFLYNSAAPVPDRFQGSFGAGDGFFATQREGDFASRRASREELDAFAGLIGVPTSWVRNGVPTHRSANR